MDSSERYRPTHSGVTPRTWRSRSRRKELQDKLTKRLLNGDDNGDELSPLVPELLLESHCLLAWGPFRRDKRMVMDAQLVIMVRISIAQDLSEGDLVEARACQRDVVSRYPDSCVQFSAMPDFGSMFQRLALEMLVQQSCRVLLLKQGMIGMVRQRNVQPTPPKYLNWDNPPLELLQDAKKARAVSSACDGPPVGLLVGRHFKWLSLFLVLFQCRFVQLEGIRHSANANRRFVRLRT